MEGMLFIRKGNREKNGYRGTEEERRKEVVKEERGSFASGERVLPQWKISGSILVLGLYDKFPCDSYHLEIETTIYQQNSFVQDF